MAATGTVVALSGGIGGAKLALGLARRLAPGALAVVANVGDDFSHLGLHVSPDIDTLVYTLAGLADPQQGWGRAGETWSFMSALAELGGPSWFRLGDGDLAMHVMRTHRLAQGVPLSQVTAEVCASLRIATRILPVTDDPVRTRVRTDQGWLDFQDWFVGHRAALTVRELAFAGAAEATPLPAVLAALAAPDLRAVVICPSNPLISIEPILVVPGMRAALAACKAPVIAVSPLIGGRAVKGPTAAMLTDLGGAATAAAVAERYRDLLDGYVIDEADRAALDALHVPAIATRTLMITLADRERLAADVLAFADRLGASA
ncbi:2-phospho-L-lactate transferase [Rhodoplanes sp. TEM]|uniref:2-phospho-L-lactate transferase n=1 Tax=Rhodoplanes tepidamans TaxID=200616 RepID=A0ABT5JJA8_RHOTP|nr:MULTISPECIES: 2-phospho-L-lactate transferase [Rhodoplanes]MDC7789677.1 2-phospho-L-lactate transferase [Rhodoplanes tepidamans]MDC7983846.1 2-phospho-L-lactate transferase [Rhodoplanes sp. TEM]MDQ0359145.1 LPPG:FO 2-phospho-L-lactate transferase [Rhodoplanes tepidamans]